jgi:hypothetical protein
VEIVAEPQTAQGDELRRWGGLCCQPASVRAPTRFNIHAQRHAGTHTGIFSESGYCRTVPSLTEPCPPRVCCLWRCFPQSYHYLLFLHHPRTDNNNDATASQSVRMRRHTTRTSRQSLPHPSPSADSVTRAIQHYCARRLSNSVLNPWLRHPYHTASRRILHLLTDT